MNMVPCPNGGKCGSKRHRVGSLAYKQCVEMKAAGTRKPATPSAGAMKPPTPSTNGGGEGAKPNISLAISKAPAYKQVGSPIFDGLNLDRDQIQEYINNPYGLFTTELQDCALKKNIMDNIEDIISDAGLDIDEMSHEEIDNAAAHAFYGVRKVEAANGLAARMRPRTFVADAIETEYAKERVAEGLHKATANHEVGSDDWYATLADGYIDYKMRMEYLQYNIPEEERQSAMDSDRQAIAAALRECLDRRIKWVNDDNLPGIGFVWTGSLTDVAPRDEQQELVVQSPHIFITEPYDRDVVSYSGNVDSSPVRLSGDYVARIPSKYNAEIGRTSGIRDDKTADSRFFDYPLGLAIDKFKANVTRR